MYTVFGNDVHEYETGGPRVTTDHPFSGRYRDKKLLSDQLSFDKDTHNYRSIGSLRLGEQSASGKLIRPRVLPLIKVKPIAR